jgi:hypothetical protein
MIDFNKLSDILEFSNPHDFSELLGKTLTNVEVDKDNEVIQFFCSDGSSYALYHMQDCYERVTLKQVDGDFEDLLNHPLLMAEEVSNIDLEDPEDEELEKYETSSWTFYKLATVKGYVTIQWFGISNGCYSEKAELHKIT